jgi:starch synthase (maltosyl-transferring)
MPVRRADARRRVVIEGVEPEVDGGRFPVKRTVGEPVVVEADVFADGHDELAVILLQRREGATDWYEIPMEPQGNDRWQARFDVTELGRYRYTLMGWIDRFGTWRRDLTRRIAAEQDVATDLLIGADIVEVAARRATGTDRRALKAELSRLRGDDRTDAVEAALEPGLERLVAAHTDRRLATRYERELTVVVDPERARFSSWYELFPRSASPEPGRHGTFADVEARLPYVAELGFDVLYLPPVHPIGRTHRKGPNNTERSRPKDPGSPWAIGSEEGGHTGIHPELGTLADFDHLVNAAKARGIEIAMDLAFQCSPDHPWALKHPEWFRHRPDGTIQYAENPPKKYQDIYPIDFETEAREELWEELAGVVRFWLGHGIRIFRVDNPHTKPFAFWEWLIGGVKADHPDAIFLSEAFTRPKVMYRLAKVGFTQSYTYFAWRNTAWELREYFGRDLPAVREFFRPNLWPNTPDILTEHLQTGGRPAFIARVVLAATLGASYGIYGPPFELLEHEPREPGSEEYRGSEKYQIRHWDLDRPDSLREIIARVNRIRRENPSLQQDRRLQFHDVGNEALLAYSKSSEDESNTVLVVVNVDPFHTQSGWLHLPPERLGLDPDAAYQVHDLLSDARYQWHGADQYVELNPHVLPAHVFRVRQRIRSERDFEYFV